MNLYKTPYFFAAIVFSILTISCSSKKEGEMQKRGNALLQVDAIVVKPQFFENKLSVNADLLPFEETKIEAAIAGNVLAINFSEGQMVKKGDQLVQLDDRKLQAQLKGLNAKLITAKSDFNRQQALLKSEGTSVEMVEMAASAVTQLEAQIEELKVNISLANITAPYSGRVGLRDFSLGSYITQGQLITNLVQTNKLKIDFNIQSQYLTSIKQGNNVKVTLLGDTLNATIFAIDPVADVTSRTTRVRAVFENPNDKYVPGGFALAQVTVNTDSAALIVPTFVVIPDLNAQIVYVYRHGKALRKEVILGVRTDKYIQILSGINAQDTIISTGLLSLQNEMMVNIKK